MIVAAWSVAAALIAGTVGGDESWQGYLRWAEAQKYLLLDMTVGSCYIAVDGEVSGEYWWSQQFARRGAEQHCFVRTVVRPSFARLPAPRSSGPIKPRTKATKAVSLPKPTELFSRQNEFALSIHPADADSEQRLRASGSLPWPNGRVNSNWLGTPLAPLCGDVFATLGDWTADARVVEESAAGPLRRLRFAETELGTLTLDVDPARDYAPMLWHMERGLKHLMYPKETLRQVTARRAPNHEVPPGEVVRSEQVVRVVKLERYADRWFPAAVDFNITTYDTAGKSISWRQEADVHSVGGVVTDADVALRTTLPEGFPVAVNGRSGLAYEWRGGTLALSEDPQAQAAAAALASRPRRRGNSWLWWTSAAAATALVGGAACWRWRRGQWS